jgi:outer membrane immunogenic protein
MITAADIAEVAIVDTWTGLYISAGGGYQWGAFDVDTESCSGADCNNDASDGEIYSVDLEDSGWFATGQLGFDYQIHDSFVIGAMIDVSGGEELEDSEFNEVDYTGGSDEEGQYWDASLEGMLTLSGRAGFLVTPDALIYGLGGWSWAKAEVSAFEGCDFNDDGGACDDVRADNDETLDGWTLGAGVEWAFIDNFSARLEYRYTDLGSIDAEGSNGIYSVETETDVTVQSVRLTLNYRF